MGMSQGSKYNDEIRREAVLKYAECGSLAEVSEAIGVPRKTLSDWKRSDWWDQITAELHGELHGELVGEPHTPGPLVEAGSSYTDTQRREACLLYSIEGNMVRVSKVLNIPRPTLQGWKESDWWVELTDVLRTEKDDHIEAQLSKIVDLANKETIDRLENGDVFVHQGEIIRAPIKAKDAAVISGIGIEKTRLIQNKPTVIRGKTESMTDLLEQFRVIARQDNVARIVSEQ